MGHIDPTKEVFAQFRDSDRPGPIHMLNLVRLRAQAAYPDGRKASGAEAYAAYGRESGPVFERLGGRIVWQGRFELMLIGPEAERWDQAGAEPAHVASAYLVFVAIDISSAPPACAAPVVIAPAHALPGRSCASGPPNQSPIIAGPVETPVKPALPFPSPESPL